MTFLSHTLMAVALAKGFDLSLPFVVAGALFPDMAEMFVQKIVLRSGRTIWAGLSVAAHRTWTHSLLIAFVCLVAGWHLPPVRDFFVGVLFGHLFLDSMTAMGVPVLDGRTRRVTLFGGKIRTWTLGELFVAVLLSFFAYAVVPSLTITKNIDKLYQAGLIDRYEYEQKKKALFGFFKKEDPSPADIPDFMRVPEFPHFSGEAD